MRTIGAKTRLARRIGEPLRDKDAKFLVKRNYPPGVHGQDRRRLSEYGRQLKEKQKAKWIYGVTEKQFRRYVDTSVKNKQLTSEVLLASLELRLDNVVYRLGFGSSRAQARQLVSHGFITVNAKKVSIPSYQVKTGDEVAFAPAKATGKFVQQVAPKLKDFKTQEWLSLFSADLKGKVLSKPTLENTGSTIQMGSIIEYYSR